LPRVRLAKPVLLEEKAMSNDVTRREALKFVTAAPALACLAGAARAQEKAGGPPGSAPKDLSKLLVPDDRKAAVQALKAWLHARGFDCKEHKSGESLQFKRGVLLNIFPLVQNGGLDRLLMVAYYAPEEEYKGSEELKKLAARTNEAQNLLRVYVTTDGYLGVSGNLTFYDELTARVFDAFVDEMSTIIRRDILSDAAVKKLLK
jgi:hypothetical protein